MQTYKNTIQNPVKLQTGYQGFSHIFRYPQTGNQQSEKNQ